MKLVGPAGVLGLTTHEAYTQKHAEEPSLVIKRERAKAGGAKVDEALTVITAYANDGRWVADCPNCNSGISLQREWESACCFGCGVSYKADQIDWPEEFDAIEDELMKRPMKNQNWYPHETVADLVTERELATAQAKTQAANRAAKVAARQGKKGSSL